MSSFIQSRWADSAFAHEYRENSDHYIPERQYLFHVLRSFFRRFVASPGGRLARICDLGCGDGVLTEQLTATGIPLKATLVDGSQEMLEAAQRRLQHPMGMVYLQRGFEELNQDSSTLGTFDFVVSGFAIHHLHRPERKRLFETIARHLAPGGYFMNVETALPQVDGFSEWYFELWREWIAAHSQQAGLGNRFAGIPDQARANPDNKYSSLEDQLADLGAAGLGDVACHYRNGIFAIYTARKPGDADALKTGPG
jgi:tRNA (cmo5U34)-methyltransferase